TAPSTYLTRPLSSSFSEQYVAAAQNPNSGSSVVDVQSSTVYTYDAFSSPLTITTSTQPGVSSPGQGGSIDIVSTTYNNDTSAGGWLIGQPATVTHRRQKSGTPDIVRNV